jgi:sugar O-acyltransferase (sialic acid O-acetyltransferase NeuD family)
MKTVIYGSRPDGQANVIVELAAAYPQLELVGLLDDYPENSERMVGSLRVVGTGEDLASVRTSGVEALLLGFGESAGRAAIHARALEAGFALPNLVHGSSVVSPSASLGSGVQVFPLAYIGPNASLTDAVLVNTAAIVEHDVVLEAGAVISPNATVSGRARVGSDSTVGAGATILPDVVIGERAVVGAGAVVVRDVRSGERVAGVPAKPLGGDA